MVGQGGLGRCTIHSLAALNYLKERLSTRAGEPLGTRPGEDGGQAKVCPSLSAMSRKALCAVWESDSSHNFFEASFNLALFHFKER